MQALSHLLQLSALAFAHEEDTHIPDVGVDAAGIGACGERAGGALTARLAALEHRDRLQAVRPADLCGRLLAAALTRIGIGAVEPVAHRHIVRQEDRKTDRALHLLDRLALFLIRVGAPGEAHDHLVGPELIGGQRFELDLLEPGAAQQTPAAVIVLAA